MQNIGFLFSLEPWLNRVYADPAAFRSAERRHLEFFNTNPMTASFVLGAVGGMEERLGRLPDGERQAFEVRIAHVKKAMASSLAAIGDSLFWGAMKPSCAAVALMLGAFWRASGQRHSIGLCLLAYLVLFNLPTLWARWRGLELGYSAQENLPQTLAGYHWQGKAREVKRIGLAATGLACACALVARPWGGPSRLWDTSAVALCLVLRMTVASTPACYAALIFFGCLLSLR